MAVKKIKFADFTLTMALQAIYTSRQYCMETFKPITPSRGRAALLATACLLTPLMAGEPISSNGNVGNETAHSSVAMQEVRELLTKGDEAYTAGRYSEAVEAYAGARDLLPKTSAPDDFRNAVIERHVQASVEHARVLSRKGDVPQAKSILEKILADSATQKHPGASKLLAELNDPIRTNPALTAEHARNVDQVRRGLYTAEGAFNLGKYEDATARYEGVLRIDPTNSAARRGMEQVAAAKSSYGDAGYDHTRAEMLAQVEAGWELQPPAVDLDPHLTAVGGGAIVDEHITLSNKLDRIIIPSLVLDDASLQDALELLRVRATQHDTTELDPNRKGVNINANLGPDSSPETAEILKKRFNLRLNNIPLRDALRYITETTGTSFRTEDYTVLITPGSSTASELISRSYKVPPDFISSLSNSSASAPSGGNDPFAQNNSSTGILPTRLGAQEALTQQGVTFPEGASAVYMASSNLLRVVNTPSNQDFISQLIETSTRTEPVAVSVKVTMLKVEQNRLEELGFDWILDNIGFGGAGLSPGSSLLNVSGGTVGNGAALDDIALPQTQTTRNPVTSGNRSGDGAISGNAIDNLLTTGTGRQGSNRAPGILGFRGTINDTSVQMLMRGLDQKKAVDVMTTTSVVTRSGQSTSVEVIREFMYATEYEPPELPNEVGSGRTAPVTPATPTAFETEKVGTTLEILPVVDDQRQYINITLNPILSEFDGYVNYGSPINSTVNTLLGPETVAITENSILMPIFSKKSVSTNVDVLDGHTVVIGGLKQETIQNVEDKTPILGDIPLAGRLFQSKAKQATSTAIIFLVNVELLDPTGRPYRNR